MNAFEQLEKQQQQQHQNVYQTQNIGVPAGIYAQPHYQPPTSYQAQYGGMYGAQGYPQQYNNYYPANYYGQAAPGGVASYWQQPSLGQGFNYSQGYQNSQYTTQASSSQNTSQSNSAIQSSQQNISPENESEKSNSKWSQPITVHEIEQFRQRYMPWSKQYTPSNLQNNQSNTQAEQNPAAAAAMKLSVKCPDKLSSYIERAFQKCINQQERDFMDATLKKICNACKVRGNLLSKDWDALQLPSLPREGPQYTTINARLENMDVIIPPSTNFQSNQNLQSFQLQPQVPLSQQNPSLISSFSQNITFNKQPLIAPQLKTFQNSNLVSNSAEQVSEEDMKKRKQRLEKFNSQAQSTPPTSTQKLSSFSSVQNSKHDKFSSLSNKNSISYSSSNKVFSTQFSALDFDSNDLESLNAQVSIKGTCTRLEKSYFRLTSAPDPSDVRPEFVLRKALKMILNKWKNKETDYRYIDEQFRSMRQDMTIQRLENEFCVKVYEAHARIALECADLDQFNQCQTQLHHLYKSGMQGHRIEFLAYKILYQVFCEMDTETLKMLKSLTFEEKQCEPIQHALSVRKQLASGNYARFFKLYRTAPNMGGYLMDVFIEKLRIMSLQKMALAYIAGNVEVGYLSHILAFDDQKLADQFLCQIGCKIVQQEDGKRYIVCRESLPAIKKAPLKVKTCQK